MDDSYEPFELVKGDEKGADLGDDSEEDIEGEGNDVIIDRADSAVAGTNSLIITDNVDAADPTFMISVTFDRDQN